MKSRTDALRPIQEAFLRAFTGSNRTALAEQAFIAGWNAARRSDVSIVGLPQGDNIVAGPSNVDQRVAVVASGANEVAADLVNLGLNSPEHDAKAAGFAGPHGGDPTAPCPHALGGPRMEEPSKGDGDVATAIEPDAWARTQWQERHLHSNGGDTPLMKLVRQVWAAALAHGVAATPE